MHLSHPQTIFFPVLEKIVLYETNLWCQNCWGPLKQRIQLFDQHETQKTLVECVKEACHPCEAGEKRTEI